MRLVDRRTGKPSMFGGCTVRIEGEDNAGAVDVSVAYCNTGKPEQMVDLPVAEGETPLAEYIPAVKPDHFCKAIGRQQAYLAPKKLVPLRFLPSELTWIAQNLARRTKKPVYDVDFSYTMKYFLPKE